MSELKTMAEILHSTALDASNPGYPGRFRLVLAITFRHCPSDLNASVRERFDEPFEQQHVCWELNAVQGPWAAQESNGDLQWQEVQYKDLKAVRTGADFLSLVYLHLVPAAGVSA